MLEFIIGLPFEVRSGRINCVLYVLPHKPGETAFGLVDGWYYWLSEPDPGGPEGPFNSNREARTDFAHNIDVARRTCPRAGDDGHRLCGAEPCGCPKFVLCEHDALRAD